MIPVNSNEILEYIKSNTYKITGHKRKKIAYINLISAFDIETSIIPDTEQSILYIWQFAIGTPLAAQYHAFYGRYWEEFKSLLALINAHLVEKDCRLIIYVHNLSYEFQYLRTVLEFTDVFCIAKRKILRAIYGNIEFRCSYLLSNMSLSAWTNKFHVKHSKLDGEAFDYSETRYPWTLLTPDQLRYCENDVLGLCECIENQLKLHDDTLATIPLTSTGYVRRDAKNAIYSQRPIKLLSDENLYPILREAFRGGDTHANRYYVGNILTDVSSVDRASSYPDVQCNREFPMEPFHEVSPSLHNLTLYFENYHYPLLARLRFTNIHLRDRFNGFPYISLSKCRRFINPLCDNGRILSADNLELTVTDIDYDIIQSTYQYDDIEVLTLHVSRYAMLPKRLRDVILQYYTDKTRLKGVPGQELYYAKSKNMLNSVYGMTAQDPGKPRILVAGLEYIEDPAPLSKILAEYNKTAFLPYQWGVWTTAHARHALYEGIQLAGENAVYCDTDSIKHVGKINLQSFNKEAITSSKRNGAYALDTHNTPQYMGVFEYEGSYEKFITWGAKKYCYTKASRLNVVVSGVVKNRSAIELEMKGGIESFKPGFVFTDSGGTRIVYNDIEPTTLVIDNHPLLLTSNATILPVEYTLGITSEYDDILRHIYD